MRPRKICEIHKEDLRVLDLNAQNIIVFNWYSSFDGGMTVKTEVKAVKFFGIVDFERTVSLVVILG